MWSSYFSGWFCILLFLQLHIQELETTMMSKFLKHVFKTKPTKISFFLSYYSNIQKYIDWSIKQKIISKIVKLFNILYHG